MSTGSDLNVTNAGSKHEGGVNSSSGASHASLTSAIFKLATSRGIVIAISFATAPILGRLFLPHAYGAVGVLTTILSILAAFTSLSYVSAIPLAGTLVERRNLFVLCSIIGLIGTVVVAMGSFLGADLLAAAFHEPDVSRYALFLPLLFLAMGARQLLDTTLGCQKRFGAVAVRNVLEVTVTRISQLGLGVSGLRNSPTALILGTLAGNLVAALTSGVSSIRDVFRSVKDPFTITDLRGVAGKHRKFPLVQLWSTSINAVTLGLPALVLGVRFTVEAVGLYNMAYTMATLPLALFIGGTNQVFYVEAGERVAHNQSVAPATMHLLRVIAIVTSLPLVAVLVMGPPVFEIFLGPKWREAGVFAQVLVPWMALMAVSQPLSVVFAIFNRQGEGFIWNIVLLAARFSALYFGGMFLGIRATMALFVAVSVILIAGLIWRALFLLDVSLKWASLTLARAYFVPLLLLAPAGILYWVFSATFISMFALAAACAAYTVVIYWSHPQIVKPLLARLGFKFVSAGQPA